MTNPNALLGAAGTVFAMIISAIVISEIWQATTNL